MQFQYQALAEVLLQASSPPTVPDFNAWASPNYIPTAVEDIDYLIDGFYFNSELIDTSGWVADEIAIPFDVTFDALDYLYPQNYSFLGFLNVVWPVTPYPPTQQPLPDITLENSEYLQPQDYGFVSYLNPFVPHGGTTVNSLFYKRRRFL